MQRIWTEERIEILKTYLKNNLGTKIIAKKMNVSYDAVENAIRRYGLAEYRVLAPATNAFIQNLNLEDLSEEKFQADKERAKLTWTLPKTPTAKSDKKKDYELVLLWPDTHIPHHNPAAVKVVLKVMDDYKFDKIVNIGDFLDYGSISHWNRNRHKTLELKRLKKDYIEGNAILDAMDQKLPKHCEKYFLKGNHECVDSQTELLTQRGWITQEQISLTDKVLSFNPQTKHGEWVDIDRVIRSYYSGLLNRMRTNTIDLLATDDHKIFNYNRSTKKYEYIPIKDLTANNRYQIPVSCNIPDREDYPITDVVLRLIAWVLTDGSVSVTPNQTHVQIYQSKETWKDIQDLIERAGLYYRFVKRDRVIKEICNVAVKTMLPQREFHFDPKSSDFLNQYLNNSKALPGWVYALSNRQFELFLDTLIAGDGSRHKSCPLTSLMLYGTKEFLEQVQTICIQRGYCATLSTYRGKQYRLNLNRRSNHSFNGTQDFTKEYYNGIVWDLTVRNHNFMVRRNGKCYFTGNCWVQDLLEDFPQLEGLIEPESQLFLTERGYKIYQYNDILTLGKLNITHGIYANQNTTKKHLDDLKVNIAFGHTHTLEMRLSASAAREIAFAGYNIGCLCDLNPDYMKLRPSAWSHGFAVAYLFPNGYFDVQLIRIVEGRGIFHGKVYDGNV